MIIFKPKVDQDRQEKILKISDSIPLIETINKNSSKLNDQEKERQAKITDQPYNEILGFMPLRGDFEQEFDNEAESFQADMEFNEDDQT